VCVCVCTKSGQNVYTLLFPLQLIIVKISIFRYQDLCKATRNAITKIIAHNSNWISYATASCLKSNDSGTLMFIQN